MIGEKILIIDDEREICELVSTYLAKEGFEPLTALTGTDGLEKIRQHKPNLVIVDFNLPDIEGPELCLKIRGITNIPVLFLSCRAEEIDKIISFSAGADDYITKPFMAGELIARIKAVLRRYRITDQEKVEEEASNIISIGGLSIDSESRQVFHGNDEILLTAKEFDILHLLSENPKRIYSADQLFEIIWRSSYVTGDSKTVSVHISSLRKKLQVTGKEYIINMRGIGYKFNHSLI